MGTYSIIVSGVLPNLTTALAFTLDVLIDCSVCHPAVITIDPTPASIFLEPSSTLTETFYFGGSASVITWDSSTDITSDINCGAMYQEVVDITSGAESPIDTSISPSIRLPRAQSQH